MTSKSDRKNARGNFLTRSKQFQELLDKAFKDCDTDKSGSISKSELYVGMLSIHLTLAKYAGPAACYVSTVQQKNVNNGAVLELN